MLSRKFGRYAIGWDVLFLGMHWIVVFTGLRVIVTEYIMSPLAEKAGIHKTKGKTRFAEQAWIYVYAGLFWSVGMVLCTRYETSFYSNIDCSTSCTTRSIGLPWSTCGGAGLTGRWM